MHKIFSTIYAHVNSVNKITPPVIFITRRKVFICPPIFSLIACVSESFSACIESASPLPVVSPELPPEPAVSPDPSPVPIKRVEVFAAVKVAAAVSLSAPVPLPSPFSLLPLPEFPDNICASISVISLSAISFISSSFSPDSPVIDRNISEVSVHETFTFHSGNTKYASTEARQIAVMITLKINATPLFFTVYPLMICSPFFCSRIACAVAIKTIKL